MPDPAADPPAAPKKPPRRRWLQFSLRTLLLLMFAAACISAWFGMQYQRGQEQKEFIAWAESQNAAFIYHQEIAEDDWRRRWFSDWYPPPVQSIHFMGYDPSVDVSRLSSFTYLEHLDISNSTRTDLTPLLKLKRIKSLGLVVVEQDQLATIAKLQGLQYLSIEEAGHIHDLTPLSQLHALETLKIERSAVLDLSPLAELDKLTDLHLPDTQVSDLSPLAKLYDLEFVILENSAVCDLQPLAALTNLLYLDLKNTPVADLGPLAGLQRLEELDLAGTQVANIAPLADLPTLKWLSLWNTPFSDISSLDRGFAALEAIYVPDTIGYEVLESYWESDSDSDLYLMDRNPHARHGSRETSPVID